MSGSLVSCVNSNGMLIMSVKNGVHQEALMLLTYYIIIDYREMKNSYSLYVSFRTSIYGCEEDF